MAPRLLDRANDAVIENPRRIVVTFLVVTAAFAFGLGNVSTTAGTQQFAEQTPAQRALEAVNEDFRPPFATDTGSTQLIQSSQNVLARPALLRMLRAQDRLEAHDALRVTDTASAASIVARTLAPNARDPAAQIRAVERATPGEIDRAVRTAAAENPRFAALVSEDFNGEAASASATIAVVTHAVPAGIRTGAGQGGTSPLTAIQQRVRFAVGGSGGSGGSDIRVFGSGIIAAEFSRVILDSLLITVPAAVLFILLFLVVAYRDLADLLLGTGALAMAIVWTFGFMGLAGIPFSQVLIAVPPLLLAVGIDFGIHAVNRYREETAAGHGVHRAMDRATDQLVVAFLVVTGTTVIGFGANLSSALPPIRDFGLVASVGIVFTFLVFGVFLPAAKVLLDDARETYPIPTFATTPLGTQGGLDRVLTGGVAIARTAPVGFLVGMLLVSAGAGVYATGVDTTFSTEDFLPPEEPADYLESLPEPFRPGEYTVTRDLNFLERKFSAAQDDTVTVYLEGDMERDTALESIHRANDDPPPTFVREDGRADTTSIVTVVRDVASRNRAFGRLVERNDRNDNGIPDDNLDEVYDHLLDSPARETVRSYLSADRHTARVVYQVKAGAGQREITEDATSVADRYRVTATATGSTVVFQAVSELILESALVSLVIALGGTVGFLLVVYRLLDGRASLGLANTVPILVAVAFVAGTMRLVGISFNAFTATILAITIGLGIDYSVHVTHRFVDEYRERDAFAALERTTVGTGGALAGSMLTTVFGIGVLVLAVFPAIGQFGLLTAMSVVYSFLASLFVLPSALVVWAGTVENEP